MQCVTLMKKEKTEKDTTEKQKKKQQTTKARITLMRNVRLFLAQNNFQWDVIDQVCPNKYRIKGVLKIDKAEITGETEKDEKIAKCVLLGVSQYMQPKYIQIIYYSDQ